MLNVKDTLSTVCAVLGTICGAVLVLPTQGVVIPAIITTIATILVVLSGAVIGILTGKNPNGTTKAIDPKTGQQEIPAQAAQK